MRSHDEIDAEIREANEAVREAKRHKRAERGLRRYEKSNRKLNVVNVVHEPENYQGPTYILEEPRDEQPSLPA